MEIVYKFVMVFSCKQLKFLPICLCFEN